MGIDVLKLLKKDLKVILRLNRNSLIILIYPICMSFPLINGDNTHGVQMLVSAIALASFMLIVGSISSEEKNGVNNVFRSLPVKRVSIIISKYVYSLLIIFFIIIISSIVPFIKYIITGNSDVVISVFINSFVYCMFIYSIFFPLYYKFGYSKLMIINMVIVYGLIFIPIIITLFNSFSYIKDIEIILINITNIVTENSLYAVFTALLIFITSVFISALVENDE